MAFQDFDAINERRKNEKKHRLQRKIAIGAVCSVILIGLIGTAGFVIVSNNAQDNNKSKNTPPSSSYPSQSNAEQVSITQKLVKTVCSAASYKGKCEESLSKEVKKDPKIAQPKDILKLAISIAHEEINKAMNKTNNIKFETEKDKGAYEDCKKLLESARNDLLNSSSHVGSIDITRLTSTATSSDLNSWLSAAIAFQGACLDGFSEGELKKELESVFKDSKEYVSNSLAILAELRRFFSLTFTEGSSASGRNSLSSSSSSSSQSGAPEWMKDDERRMLRAANTKLTPNVTVAQDGSGNFTTITEALQAIPRKYDGRYVVYVKAGVYNENVTVTSHMPNLTMYGDGSQKSIITGDRNFVDGVRTFQTASFAMEAEGFIGKAMGFRNTAGAAKHQAVAARIQGDRAVFVNCRFEGYQDTLYVLAHRQFFRSCVISGTIDFIFGDAAAVFQNCIMNIRKPLDNQQNIVTAQGRKDPQEQTAIVLQNCKIQADRSLAEVKGQFKSYLGRPWKEYSRTIVMESQIDDVIHPDGWMPWQGTFGLDTLFYAEYNNTGPGSSVDNRVKWAGIKNITRDQAAEFSVSTFLAGDWLSGSHVPVQRGLYY